MPFVLAGIKSIQNKISFKSINLNNIAFSYLHTIKKMRQRVNIKPLLFISLSIFFISCLLAEDKTAVHASLKNNELINGVSFVASNEPVVDSDFISIKNINANWVALMPFAFMRYIDSPGLLYNRYGQAGESFLDL